MWHDHLCLPYKAGQTECVLPQLLQNLWMTMGSTRVEHLLQAILPARAATEGMAGASKASANTRLYVRPKVVFPKRETMPYAIRLPRPDLMKPPDSQNAMAINHLSRAKTRTSSRLQAAFEVSNWLVSHKLLRNLAGEGTESCCKGQGLGQHCGPQSHHSHSSQR